MSTAPERPSARFAGFRTKLLAAIMLVVSATTLLALYFAERSLAANVAEDLEREFEAELAAVQRAEAVRSAALVERCRTLVRKPRIRAAFEDNALDLLYPNAEDELRDILGRDNDPSGFALRAQFYRFLDSRGTVIPPPARGNVGVLSPEDQASLALPRIPLSPQTGYFVRRAGDTEVIATTIAMPIISADTGEAIGALVLGFSQAARADAPAASEMKRALWLGGRLHSTDFGPTTLREITEQLTEPLKPASPAVAAKRLILEGVPHLLFAQPLNSGSLFPPAHEICVYPLTGLAARQKKLRWQVLGAGGLLLVLGFAASHLVARRLANPVERLAVDSEEDRNRRARAEAALEITHAELQRSARFSADASHQLKTPVTVLRAGLEELVSREGRTPAECQEISALIHQTYRLSSLIEDLLLLSRLDAGRLQLTVTPVNLSQLIEAALDDLSALPDDLDLAVETDFPPDLHIAGEKRYTAMILQNLLENARKYNHPGGRIQLRVTTGEGRARLTIVNTGRPIPPASQTHIFERFHRGTVGENVPGYGLGLNLARELARLHQGDLRLVRSDNDATEFEATFRLAAA